MIIRRYTGPSMEQVRNAIARDLGRDAVVIHSDKRRGKGLIPGLSRTVFEVTAVLEEPHDAASPRPAAPVPEGLDLTPFLEAQKQQYRGLRQSMRLLDEKLADMDELMVMVNRRLETVDAPPLLENVHRSWQDSVLSRARELCGSDGVPDAAQLFTALVEQIPVQAGLEFSAADGRRGPSAFALIGPTGVGKTTTLAKLAAKCVLGENLKVGLVTLDTFRLAGVDQLREYAGLLGVELRVAFSATELTRHMEHFRDRDVILIDTPGRSQFDEEGIQAVRDGIGPVPGVCTLLTVPAGLRREDATSIVESYSALSPRGLVLTKSDEATRCDGLSTLFEKAGVPVVYLTDGQRVPEDIHEASAEAVASMIVANDAISVGAGTGDCGHAVDE